MAWGSCYTPEFRVVSILGAAAGTTATINRRLVEAITGTPTFVLDAIDTGRYSMRVVGAAQAEISLASNTAAQAVAGSIARIKITAFTTDCYLFGFTTSSVGSSVFIRVNASTGVLSYSLNNAGAFTNSGFSFTAGAIHAVEVYVDMTTSSAHLLKIRVDGTEVVNTTGGPAISTTVAATGLRFGMLAASASMTVDYADMATYGASGEYGTIGADWRVHGLEPVSDGTHLTSADFQNQASSSLSGTTTSWQLVDDAPAAAPSTTDFVKQTTAATAYLEWVLDAVPSSGYSDPELVCLAAAVHPVGSALANSAQFRLRALNADATTSAEAAVDASTTSDTLEYRKHSYVARPVTGAAWVIGDVTSAAPLRARFGYAGDISPPPACDAIMAFVLTPAITNQTVSPPAATASASSSVPDVNLSIPEVNMARTRS